MTNQHTPGPWRVGDREPYVEVWGPMRMNSNPILASMESEPREANARMMAAAPDMLAALKAYVIAQPQCDCSEHSGCDLAAARASAGRAIAKAEGRT